MGMVLESSFSDDEVDGWTALRSLVENSFENKMYLDQIVKGV